MKITAAVATAPQSPFELRSVELESPRPDEVLVKIVGTGLCHTDLIARDQFIPIQLPAVLGHEVSHVANGDMVTMGLLQGVVNTFVIFLSRVIGHVVDRVVFKTERGYGPAYYITSIVAQIFLSILASTIGT